MVESVFLTRVEQIEIKKQKFKEKNNLTDVSNDASVNINQQLSYDTDLFFAESQLDLIALLEDGINDDKFNFMPVDIGIKNEIINSVISDFNTAIKERNRFLISVGKNNPLILNIDNQINSIYQNLFSSIKNYKLSLEKSIENLKLKESEYETFYRSIPQIEKTLRSIERELEIKEALFLLLLQKREEASINFAVIKPTIKIIDTARSSKIPISPIPIYVYSFGFAMGFLVPFILIFAYRSLNTKIQSKADLDHLLNGISVMGKYLI